MSYLITIVNTLLLVFTFSFILLPVIFLNQFLNNSNYGYVFVTIIFIINIILLITLAIIKDKYENPQTSVKLKEE